MASIPELLAAAAASCRCGQFGSAEQAYQRVLELDPGHAEALSQLGLLAYHGGRPGQAVEYLGRAAAARPADAEAHNNLGAALLGRGQAREAEAAFRAALRLRPEYAEGHANLGNALHAQGRLAEAEAAYREALRLRPDLAEAHNNLGNVLYAQGRPAEAEAACRAALRLRPDYVEALATLGNALYAQGRPAEAEAACRAALLLRPDLAEALATLGNALYAQRQLAEAEIVYRAALRRQPGNADVQNNLGNALRNQRRPVEAEAEYRAALRLRPGCAETHSNLGNALWEQGRLDEAEATFREALRLRPDVAEAHNGLGSVLHEVGRLDEAEAACREAVRLRPDFAQPRHNLGVFLLSQGRYAEGWAEYEWRWRACDLGPRAFDRPAWDGTPVPGTLLLWAEQGLGDTLQFVRYAALARERAGAVVLECPPALVPLLSRCPGVDRVIGQGAPLPAFDAHAPLVSLPRLLGTTLESVPAAVPYLVADPERVRRWREELSALPGFKVGVAWQGNPAHPEQHRFMPLRSFAPLAAVPGVRLVSLQRGPGSEQLAGAADLGVMDLGDGVDRAGAFVDTAAVIGNLDLVVTADTALAHLAGGLGAPTWLALSSVPNWRWLHGREDSPWYPTLRLFRQSRRGDWGDVFGRMAAALRERLN